MRLRLVGSAGHGLSRVRMVGRGRRIWLSGSRSLLSGMAHRRLSRVAGRTSTRARSIEVSANARITLLRHQTGSSLSTRMRSLTGLWALSGVRHLAWVRSLSGHLTRMRALSRHRRSLLSGVALRRTLRPGSLLSGMRHALRTRSLLGSRSLLSGVSHRRHLAGVRLSRSRSLLSGMRHTLRTRSLLTGVRTLLARMRAVTMSGVVAMAALSWVLRTGALRSGTSLSGMRRTLRSRTTYGRMGSLLSGMGHTLRTRTLRSGTLLSRMRHALRTRALRTGALRSRTGLSGMGHALRTRTLLGSRTTLCGMRGTLRTGAHSRTRGSLVGSGGLMGMDGARSHIGLLTV